MPGRSLRSTRKGKDANKDWSKLNDGSPLPDEVTEIVPTAISKKSSRKKKKAAKKQQQKQPSPVLSSHEHEHDGDSNDDTSSGAEICEELLLSADQGSAKYSRDGLVNKPEPSPHSSDGDDVELVKAKKKLDQLKKKEVRRRREEKLQQLVEETKRLQKSLKSSKQKKTKHETTTADLRSMSDVVARVDKLMDKKKLNFKNSSTSNSDTETASSSASANGNSSSEGEKQSRKKEKSEEKKKKSGKESKLTSDVKFPQTWPHSTLKFHFVGKEKKYDDLSLAEFCAGSMSILKTCKSSEKKARIEHMEELMYLATHKPWNSVLNYHGACLLEIERGNLKWGDNFQLHGLHSTIFNAVGHNSQRGQGGNGNGKNPSSSNSKGGSERIWFCKGYQRGNCTYTRDHYGYLNGANELLRHICAKCWLAFKKQSLHPEQSDECPLAKVDL